MHVSGRYHADELPSVSQRKSNVQSPRFIGLAQGMKAQLTSLCPGSVKTSDGESKQLLRLSQRNAMQLILSEYTSCVVDHRIVIDGVALSFRAYHDQLCTEATRRARGSG